MLLANAHLKCNYAWRKNNYGKIQENKNINENKKLIASIFCHTSLINCLGTQQLATTCRFNYAFTNVWYEWLLHLIIGYGQSRLMYNPLIIAAVSAWTKIIEYYRFILNESRTAHMFSTALFAISWWIYYYKFYANRIRLVSRNKCKKKVFLREYPY